MRTKEELEKIFNEMNPGLALLSEYYELIYEAAFKIYNLAIDDAAENAEVDKNSILKLKVS